MPPNGNTPHLVLAESSQGATPTLAATRGIFWKQEVNMASSKNSTELLSINHRDNGEWLETTPGERFKIRTSAKETKGVYTMLEVVADPRNGVPIHIHKRTRMSISLFWRGRCTSSLAMQL
jgi:hypothetical protein